MKPTETVAGSILAGGKSIRMGYNKALLTMNGMSFIQRIAGTMQRVVSRVSIIASQADTYRFIRLPVYPDVYPGCGPMGGVHSALYHAETDSVFVSSCDIPFITDDVIRLIIDYGQRHDAVVPLINGKSHPLCGLYKKSCLPVVEDHLSKGQYRMTRLLEDINPLYVPLDATHPDTFRHYLTNINTKEEYRRHCGGD
jgi:molybdenum cofactor guanylyltransferase